MKINGIKSIKNDGGPWLIVLDYHTEGLRVLSQHATLAEVAAAFTRGDTHGQPFAILYLPDCPIGDLPPFSTGSSRGE